MSTFCLLTLSDLGANWDLGSTYGCKHLTQVAPKTDNSILYFFSLTFCSQPYSEKFGPGPKRAGWVGAVRCLVTFPNAEIE